ncbi:MAG: hypothetical protein ACREQZ_01920 [Woeseiaceae bacterium]
MNSATARAALLLAAMIMGSSTATADSLWLGAKVGTMGLGLEGTWRPIPWLDLRVGANAYDYDETGFQAGVNYDGTLHLDSYYATANLLFPASPFRFTAGGYSNGNEVRLTSAENGSYDIGGTPYSAAEVGTLRSNTSFDDVAPYLGLGFDFSLFGQVGMSLDLGVLWQGDPVVTLTADGTMADDPDFQSQLDAERSELEEEFDVLKAYPVVSLGFNVNF